MEFFYLLWKKGIVVGSFLIIFSLLTSKTGAQVIFKAEHLEWTDKPALLIGRGKASLEYKDAVLEAEKIELNLESLDLLAEGRVRLESGKRRVWGESLEYSLKTREGEILSPDGIEGNIFYEASWAHLSPEVIKLSRASFTTCDLSSPHYRIKASSVRILLEDKVIAKNAVFYLGRYPFFWSPVVIRYLNKKNKIMLPSVGYSDFAGWFARTGYYFYSSPRLEGTIHLDYREKKGWAEGIDSLYKIGEGAGELKSYFIKEKDTGNERWRLKLRHEHPLSEFTSLKLNLDRVGDESFLEDYFFEEDGEDGEIPSSFISLEHQKTNYNVSFLLEPEVNPFKYNKSIQRLPQITLGFLPQKIKVTGLYLGGGSQIVNFKKGEKGLLRADCHFEVSHPLTAFERLRIEPKVGYHFFWYKDKEGVEGYRRILYQELVSSYEINGGDEEKYTYTLEPSIGYYHSAEDKDDFSPPFGLGDYEVKTEDIHPPNLMKLGVKNELYYKKKALSLGNLTAKYNLTEEKKGFSSLEGKFRLTPTLPYLNYIDLYFLYDYPEKKYKEITSNLDLRGKSWHLNIGVKVDVDEKIDDFILQGGVNLGEKWKISGYRSYDMVEDKVSEERYSLWRDLHCWAAQLSYKIKPVREYSIMFYIKAFPEFWLEFYPYFEEE